MLKPQQNTQQTQSDFSENQPTKYAQDWNFNNIKSTKHSTKKKHDAKQINKQFLCFKI